jgi:hypothetical protein
MQQLQPGIRPCQMYSESEVVASKYSKDALVVFPKNKTPVD